MALSKLETASIALQLRDPTTRQSTIREIARICRDGLTPGAKYLGIPVRTLFRWRAEDEELRRALDDARSDQR